MKSPSHALDVVIVSHGDGQWLPACLQSLERHRGADIELSVVVVENGGETLPEPGVSGFNVEVVRAPNRGFAAANNLGARLGDAPLVLFLNPDTEIRDGSLADVIDIMHSRPEIGLLATRQVAADGALHHTMRRYPTVRRAIAQGLGSERWPMIGGLVGERVLDDRAYARRTPCDWTTGAVMFIRREAMASAGDFDERFFLFSEEVDLARRITTAGWTVVHDPVLTVVHYAGKAGADPRREAQNALARVQYARKNFDPLRAQAYVLVLVLAYALRIAVGRIRAGGGRGSPSEAPAAALRVLLGRAPAPYRAPEPVERRLRPLDDS